MTKEGLLGYFPQLTFKRYHNLIRAFGSLDAAWHAPASELCQKAHWKEDLAAHFISWRTSLREDMLQEILDREGMRYVTLSDENYPPLLKEISDPPLCIFYRGTLPTAGPALAVVGTRHPSRYGTQTTTEIVSTLAQHGITIISGLALGIDALAHDTVVQQKSITIAVLGSGVDRTSVSPVSHLQLSERIIESGGCILSEYPPGTAPTPYTFPKRNRIIAGLSQGTLVIEAGENSGALITAKCCLDYNRDVFAIPHPITSLSGKGTNTLLKQGAIVVTQAEDVLSTFNVHSKPQPNEPSLPRISLNATEQTIYTMLTSTPISIDEIIAATQLSAVAVMSAVSLLEMKKAAVHIGGSRYIKK